MEKDQTHTQSTTRTTGNDPIEGVDPGGTHSTKPGQADKQAAKAPEPDATQTVSSGDRNVSTESRSAQPQEP